MTPPKPKRPPRSPRVPGDSASRPEPEVELPFDDDEVAPLQADDPRPQRVPQFPAGPRRRPRRGPPGAVREGRDRELPARFESGEYEDPGHSPAFLYVERGPGAGQLLPLKQGVLVLGRASTSDLRLQHASISRRHAQLTRRGDRLFIKDLGSQNGTYVNRVRLGGEVELHPGDELALGNALLRLRGPGPTPESPRGPVRRTDSTALRVGMSPRRLVLLAAAVGSLAAVFLTLAAVRLVRARNGSPASTVEQTQATQLVAEAEAVAEEDSEETVLAGPEASAPTSAARTRRDPGPPSLSAQAIAATGNVQEPAPRQREVPRVTKSEKSEAPRKGAVASKPVSSAEVEAEALARYEAGNVDAALTLARNARLEPLASILARFRDQWNAANTALSAQDSASAAQHLSAALELDQQLSKGWSTYAQKIRKALTQVRSGSSQGSAR